MNSLKSSDYKPGIKSPLGIFWDIENCPIPRNKSPSDVVKHIRHHIDVRHPKCGYAKEFFVVADTRRMDSHLCESLNRNGMNVVHVNGAAKNAADDKLQELMDMFVDKFGAGAVLVVITGDINFVRTIRNARLKDVVVVLIHGLKTSLDLKSAANETYLYDDVIRGADNITQNDIQIIPGVNSVDVYKRLSQLSDNCGGKVESIDGEEAVIRFGCKDDAQRAAQRIIGVDCFGHKIDVKLMDSKLNIKPYALIGKNDIKCKSVVKGLAFTLEDSKVLLRKLRNMTNSWKVIGNLIDNVEVMGKHLVVTAVSPEANQKLLLSAKLHPESGIKWEEFYTNKAKVANKNNLMSNTESIVPTNDCKSVIKGLFTKKDDNFVEIVQQLVTEWNDPLINAHFISKVTRDSGKGDGKINLFVIANNSHNNNLLINAAKKYLSDGQKWKLHNSNNQNVSEVIGHASRMPIQANHVGQMPQVTDQTSRMPIQANHVGQMPQVTGHTSRMPIQANHVGQMPQVTGQAARMPIQANHVGQMPQVTGQAARMPIQANQVGQMPQVTGQAARMPIQANHVGQMPQVTGHAARMPIQANHVGQMPQVTGHAARMPNQINNVGQMSQLYYNHQPLQTPAILMPLGYVPSQVAQMPQFANNWPIANTNTSRYESETDL